VRIFTEKAVLFLHAFPLNSGMYESQFKALEEAGISYVGVDYPGFGRERDFPTVYTIQMLTDIIVSKLSSLGVKRLIPVGTSMGGYVMFDLWRRYRELIDGLVFVATRSEADTDEGREARYTTIEKIKKEGKDFLIQLMLQVQTSPATKKDLKKMERLKCLMEEATEEGIIKALIALAERPDNTSLLPTIHVPTLVVAGKDDEMVTPPQVVKKIADGIKGAEFVVVENSAHLPPFENPQEFNRLLLQFIRKVWG